MEELTEERIIELVKDHFELEISTDIMNFENRDFMIYSESTADGYEVFIATHDPRNPSICEEVHYYDSDLSKIFTDQISYGDKSFYICDGIYEDCYFDEALVELFADVVEEVIQEAEDGEGNTNITKKEIEILKINHGLNAEEIEETVS
jgi:hypothetical protein